MKTVKERLRELEFEKGIQEEIEILRRAGVELEVSLVPSESYSKKVENEKIFQSEDEFKPIFMDEEKELWRALDYTLGKIGKDTFFIYSWDVIRNASPIRTSKEGIYKFSRWLFENGADDFLIGAEGFGIVHIGRDSLTEDGGKYSYKIGFSGVKSSEIYNKLHGDVNY